MPRRTSSKSAASSNGIIVLVIVVAAWLAYTYGPQFFGGSPTAPPAPAPTAAVRPTRTPASAPSTGAGTPNAAWQVFFTTPRYPDQPSYHVGGLDTQLVALINEAQTTVDLADYDFDLANVAQAMATAVKRGVRVRMVIDTDTLTNDDPAVQAALAIVKKAKIKIVDDQRGPIMHNKFVVVDGRWVWTGSWNFTDGDTYRLNNNGIRIDSADLALNYTTEFEKMFVARTFGPNKAPGVPNPVLTINGSRVENYFAAEDKVTSRLVPRLLAATQSIDFMAFSFTSDPLGQALLDRAKAGVVVRGVFETTGSQTKFSEYGPLKAAGLEVYTDGNPYVMHHKVFIIDGRTVIFGSFNFSDNADTANDENLLIVDDVNLAQQFEAEFLRVREQAINPPKKK